MGTEPGEERSARGQPQRTAIPVLLVLATLTACAESPGSERAALPRPESDSAWADTLPHPEAGTLYRRTIAFMDVVSDTVMFVSWDFENRVTVSGVQFSIRGWLGRTGEWDMFVREDWTTEMLRAPWRIVPHGSARIVMGFGDRWQEIYFTEGLRDVSIRPGPTTVEWMGRTDESYRVLAGSAFLAGREIPGLVLDASTAFARDTAAVSEMIFLAGEGVQLLIADGNRPERRRAWARIDTLTLAWPDVEVSWPRSVPLENTDQALPVVWRIESGRPELFGDIEAISSHQHFREGGNERPAVVSIYEVRGEITVADRVVPVAGLVRHSQR